jgi:ribonuclease VapC
VIVDSSAIVAILLRESGWEVLVAKLSAETMCAVGAPTLAEAGIVLTARLGKRAPGLLLRLVQEASLTIVPFTEDHWRVAVEAYARGQGQATVTPALLAEVRSRWGISPGRPFTPAAGRPPVAGDG